MALDNRDAPPADATEEMTFEAIFSRYYALLYQLAHRCTGDREEADDIVQEVFLRYYRTPPEVGSDGERRAWLCRVATNLGLNALRSRQRRAGREERAGTIAHGRSAEMAEEQNPERYVLASEQAELVRSVLAELPERQQSYLLLRSIGLSYAEIAQATGVAAASVGSLLARAEREFRRRYHERTTHAE